MYEELGNPRTFISLFCRGGNGLDWFSSIRCPQSIQQPIQSQLHVRRSELKTSTPKEHQSQKHFIVQEYDETQDINRVWELTLEKSMGQKKKLKGIKLTDHITDHILRL